MTESNSNERENEIRVVSIEGNVVRVEYRADMTVLQLKERCSAGFGAVARQLAFLRRNRFIADDRTLSSLGIVPGDSVIATLKLSTAIPLPIFIEPAGVTLSLGVLPYEQVFQLLDRLGLPRDEFSVITRRTRLPIAKDEFFAHISDFIFPEGIILGPPL